VSTLKILIVKFHVWLPSMPHEVAHIYKVFEVLKVTESIIASLTPKLPRRMNLCTSKSLMAKLHAWVFDNTS
jgi:hypothetical protein